MLDNLINITMFRIFKCSSTSDMWLIISMFDLEAIGVVLERGQRNFITRFHCSVSFADAILSCM